MKINYNEAENTLTILDETKSRNRIVFGIMVITFINACLFSFDYRTNQLRELGVVWIVLGVFSLAAIVYSILKKTTVAKINLDDIISLSEKSIFGNEKFSLKLKNGKSRDLPELESKLEIMELKSLLSGYGVKI